MEKDLRRPSLAREIISLAWPTMTEQLMYTAVQYIDTAMVGSLGTAAVAAVGSTTTVNWLIGSTINAFGVGFLSYISRSRGAGKAEKVRSASVQAILISIVIGLCFTCLTLSLSGVIPVWMQVDEAIRPLAGRYFFILYLPTLFRTAMIIFGAELRAVGDTKTPMRVGIIMNVVNVVLNFLLIFKTRQLSLFGLSFVLPGLGRGVSGAAEASAVSFIVGALLISRAVWRHPELTPRGQRLRPDKEVLLAALRVAIPNMFQRFATSLGYVAFAAMINSLGEISTAAHTVANTVESAFYVPGYGMQAAAATLTGEAVGAGRKKRKDALSGMIIIIEVSLMTVSGALLFIFAPQMASLFSDDAEVISLGSLVLRMVALSEPFYGVSIVIEGMMQGEGETRLPFVFNVIGMWLVRIVGTYICTRRLGLGLEYAWGCMIAHNLILFICYSVCHRIRRRKGAML